MPEEIMSMSTESPPLQPRREFPGRDAALVAAATILSVVISAHFELNEALYSLTRHGEFLQLDELPVGLLVLLAGLIWLSWKRQRQAQRELRARRIAEARLVGVLHDNRRLAQENLRIQEIERKHLARELHDELGQYLNAIKLDAVALGEGGGETATRAAQAIIRNVDHVHGVIGGMIGRLRPVGLDELGVAAAIEHCVDQWRQRLPATQFQLSVCGHFDDLGEALSLTVYRLIQEGLTNVSKHARAGRVDIALERRTAPGGGDELRVTVADDGCGMGPDARGARFGLSGMRERVQMAGGHFAVASAPGRGCRLEAVLPAGERLPAGEP